jgi:hypothetical protein
MVVVGELEVGAAVVQKTAQTHHGIAQRVVGKGHTVRLHTKIREIDLCDLTGDSSLRIRRKMFEGFSTGTQQEKSGE